MDAKTNSKYPIFFFDRKRSKDDVFAIHSV